MSSAPVVHLIDSDAESLHTIEAQLLGAGLRVQTYRRADAFFAASPTQGCVLTDLRLDGALEILSRLRKLPAKLPVLFMTDEVAIDTMIAAIRGGAADILLKPLDAGRVHRAVTAALADQRASESDIRVSEAASRIAALPPRCRDVLEGLVEGQSAKIIAHKLGISPRTVENHKINMLHRLGARHTAEAIRLAVEATLMTECAHCQHSDCPGGSDLLETLHLAGEVAKTRPQIVRRKMVSQ